jgi:hypothetical protein
LISVSALERIHTGLELIQQLENNSCISPPDNVMFLGELLWLVGRCDLLSKYLNLTINEVRSSFSDLQRKHITQYRRLLHEVCQELTRDNIANLKFLSASSISKSKLDSLQTAQDLFLVLERQRLITADSVDFLVTKLREINRHDLATKLGTLTVQSKLSSSVPCESRPQESTNTAQTLNNTANVLVPLKVTDSDPVGRLGINTARVCTEESFLQPVDHRVLQESATGLDPNIDKESRCVQHFPQLLLPPSGFLDDDSEMPCYSMTRFPRGLCVIINNEKFYKIDGDNESRKMPDRPGTQEDCDKLKDVFRSLGFNVEVKSNLTHSEMATSLLHTACSDHSLYDCFVCCILSHGALGAVYGCDGKTVAIRDLMSYFKAATCPTLRSKPKLFFVQACQGNDKQYGHTADVDTDSADSPGEVETIPNEADFLLGLATVPGFVSFRSRSAGSWYITTLVHMLNRYSSSYDILSILTRVNEEVSRAFTREHHFKQVPAPMYTLRKRVIFR